jgi:FkbM family methyltransferase
MVRSPGLFALRHHLGMVRPLILGARRGACRSWSQHGEDAKIVQELETCLARGFYVDVGANHPARISNTYRLYCKGMRGVCIEPNEIFCGLHAKYRPGDIAMCIAVGARAGLAKYYQMSQHGFSTFSDEQCRRYQEDGVALLRESYKPAFPLSTVLEQCRLPNRDVFALLSVDVEGWDEVVLRSNDWRRFRPRLVVVEYNEREAATSTTRFLEEQDYEKIGTFGCNGMFADRSARRDRS